MNTFQIQGADPGFLEVGFRCVEEGLALLILSHFS